MTKSEGADTASFVVLDACVLLNLHASGMIEKILRTLPSRFLVSSYVSREAIWCYEHRAGTAEPQRNDIDFAPLTAAGLVEIVELSPTELGALLVFARELDDGEAASGAIALTRSAVVATDDRKARSVFRRHNPSIRTITTASILRLWEQLAHPESTDVAGALQRIRRYAKFEPGRTDADAEWWRSRIERSESNGQTLKTRSTSA